MFNVISLTDFISCLELVVKGRKPRVGWHVKFEWMGQTVKAIVEEVGRAVLVRRLKDV